MAEHKNPLPTTDAVIAGPDGRVVLILRKNEPRGWALPGGFVDYGEELGHACRREAREETGLEVELIEQLFTYSDPRRDPRKHTISTVYACRVRAGTLRPLVRRIRHPLEGPLLRSRRDPARLLPLGENWRAPQALTEWANYRTRRR